MFIDRAVWHCMCFEYLRMAVVAAAVCLGFGLEILFNASREHLMGNREGVPQKKHNTS